MAVNDPNQQIRADLGVVSRQSGMGDQYTAMQNTFRGINHRGTGNPLPVNSDHYGLTFFTRPRLNLSYHNCLADRRLHPLLSEDPISIKRAVRCLLDPAGNRQEELDKADKQFLEKISSPLVDEFNAFIPPLINTLESLTGWPDVIADTWTSNAGIQKEEMSLIDGVSHNYSTFDLTGNFKNVAGDPITLLFHSWLIYATSVYGGTLMPYPDSILNNETDYNTRIYRLTLDKTRTYVQKIFSTIAIPLSSPLGSAANFTSEKPISDDNDQISMQFKCHGAEYNDPITIEEFNDVVAMFNPNMEPTVDGDHSSIVKGVANGVYAKVSSSQMQVMNYEGYCRINSKTMELEWFAPNEKFPTPAA